MPGEDLIKNIADREAVKSDKDFLVASIKEVYDEFMKLKGIKIGLEGVKLSTDVIKSVKEMETGLQKVKEKSDEAKKAAAEYAAEQKKLAETYNNVSGTLDQNIKLQLRYKQELDELKKKQKELQKEYASTGGSADALNAKQIEIAKAIEQTKQASSELQRTIRLQVKEQQAAGGSIDEMAAQYDRLFQVFRGLSDEERNSEFGQQLNADLEALSNNINEMQVSAGNFTKNVGRYPQAFAGAFNVLKDELTNIQQKLNDPSLGGQQLEQLRNQEKLLGEVLEGVTANFTSSRQEARAFQEAATKLGLTVGHQSEIFQKFRAEVGKGVDDIADIKQSIKLAASDTQGFDRLLSAATALTGAFSIAQGAAGLFGEENEELQKTLLKVQSAMAILNGLQAIQNELKNKDSILRKAVNFLVSQETKLTQAQATAQQANTAATNTATTATKGFGTALKGIGIGILLTLIPVLVSAMDGLDKVFGSTSSKAKSLQKAAADLRAEYKETSKNIAEVQVKLEMMVDRVKKGGMSFDEKKKFVKQYNKEFGDTLGVAKNYNEAEKILTDKTDDYIKALELRAKAQAALNLAIKEQQEIYNNNLDAEQKDIEFRNDLNSRLAKGTITQYEYNTALNGYTEGLKRKAAEENKEAERRKTFFTEEFKNFTKQAEALEKKENFTTDPDEGKDRQKQIEEGEKLAQALAKQRAANRQKELEAAFRTAQQNLQISANAQKAIVDDETKSLEERLKALQSFTEIQQQLITGQKNFDQQRLQEQAVREREELLSRKLTNEEKLKVYNETAEQRGVIEANASAQEIQLAADTQKRVLEIVKANNEKIKAENEKLQQENANLQDKMIEFLSGPNRRDVESAQAYAADVIALNSSLQEKKISVQEYETERANIEKKYATESLQLQLEKIRQLIAYKKSIGASTAQDEINLANLEKDISDDLTDYKIENLQKLHEMEKQLAQDVLNLIETVVMAGFDRKAQAVREEMDLVDKRKASEIEAINAQALSAEEKAARITIAEKRAQVEKEQLARKEKEIEISKAKAEKLSALLKIGIETAVQVFKIKAQAAALLSNPLTAPFAPIALAQIPLVIASGAIAAALVAAKPLPKFKHGRQDGPATLAIVGDGGKAEVIEYPTGETRVTPATDTLAWLPEHAKVYPDIDSYREASMSKSLKTPPSFDRSLVDTHQYMEEMTSRIEKSNDKVVSAIDRKPVAKITNTWSGVKVGYDSAQGFIQYENKYIKS